jgi:hypothetical protein
MWGIVGPRSFCLCLVDYFPDKFLSYMRSAQLVAHNVLEFGRGKGDNVLLEGKEVHVGSVVQGLYLRRRIRDHFRPARYMRFVNIFYHVLQFELSAKGIDKSACTFISHVHVYEPWPFGLQAHCSIQMLCQRLM